MPLARNNGNGNGNGNGNRIKKPIPSSNNGPIKNEAIPYEYVHMVDSETGQLQPPARLRDILAEMNRKEEVLHLVSVQPEPIVKMFKLRDLYEAKRAAHAKARAARVVKKEVQMTWGVNEADFKHKVKKVRAEILKGVKVDVVFAPKSGQATPPQEEMMKRIQELLEELGDDAEEYAPRTLEKRIAVLHVQRRS